MKFRAPGVSPMSIAMLSGHTISISHEEQGTEVPAVFRREALARGCVPVGVDLGDDKKSAPETKTAAEKRIAAIRAGMEKMLDSDDESAFGEDGKPDIKKLEKISGVKSISAAERDEVWTLVEASLKG